MPLVFKSYEISIYQDDQKFSYLLVSLHNNLQLWCHVRFHLVMQSSKFAWIEKRVLVYFFTIASNVIHTSFSWTIKIVSSINLWSLYQSIMQFQILQYIEFCFFYLFLILTILFNYYYYYYLNCLFLASSQWGNAIFDPLTL